MERWIDDRHEKTEAHNQRITRESEARKNAIESQQRDLKEHQQSHWKQVGSPASEAERHEREAQIMHHRKYGKD